MANQKKRNRLPAKCHPTRADWGYGLCAECLRGIKQSNRSAGIYGSGNKFIGGTFTIVHDPEGIMDRGSYFRRFDFIATLAEGHWPNGLKVRSNKGKMFTVRKRRTKKDCLVAGTGEIWEVKRPHKTGNVELIKRPIKKRKPKAKFEPPEKLVTK